jgi:drug/metabolite transporter (DMT)-like permease
MLGAVAFFAGMDAVLKLFASHYEPMQVAALRGAASLPFLIAPIALRGGWRELRPVRWPLHALRGALSVLMLWGFVFSLQTLSLADVYAIFLCAPLLIAALSVPLLRERIGWRRWAAIGVGLAGVLVMLKPSGRGLLSLGALGAAASSAGYALSAITVRVLARTDSAAAIVFWAVALLTLVAGLLALPGWRPILDEHWAWLAVMGLCGAIAQHLLTEAFRSAPPGVVAPFEYTALLWGMALDWLFWDVLPSARVWLGGAIVVASGLYLIWRERITQGRSTVHSDPATT